MPLTTHPQKTTTFNTYWLPTQHRYESPSSCARISIIHLSWHTAVAGEDALQESNKQRVRGNNFVSGDVGSKIGQIYCQLLVRLSDCILR